jgi:hypothetical protein
VARLDPELSQRYARECDSTSLHVRDALATIVKDRWTILDKAWNDYDTAVEIIMMKIDV